MHWLIIIALAISFLMRVQPHPVCQQTIDQKNTTDGPTCSTNLTANVTLLKEWLSLHDESKGIDQLRSRTENSITSILLNHTTTMVIILIYSTSFICNFTVQCIRLLKCLPINGGCSPVC